MVYPPRQIHEMSKEISSKNFKKNVIENKTPSVVKFYSEWSGACQIIGPLYCDLARSYKGEVNFYIVDAKKEEGLVNEFGIMDLPTILFFKCGLVVDHVKGLVPKHVLIDKIETILLADVK